MCLSTSATTMKRQSEHYTDTRMMTLILVLVAVTLAWVAIIAELGQVKNMASPAKAWLIALTALTISSAWLFTQTLFGLHYAHDYFHALALGHEPGINFPGTPDPDYGDFMYCAFIIGTSAQTADVVFTSKPMRRIALFHSVYSFFFNITLFAITINMAASFV
jgi:uncharacterized membrane protein